MSGPSNLVLPSRQLPAFRAPTRWLEPIPWLLALGVYFVFPDYAPLLTQIFIMVLFAMSLDLLVGYTGIVTLGHAAQFGTGAYVAGILAVRGLVTDPILSALIAMAAAGLIGLLFGSLMLRTKGLTFLMLSVASGMLLYEIANKADSLTGGFDGLQGVSFAPLFKLWEFDFRGTTAFFYSFVLLFLSFVFLRRVVNSPFGWSLRGIRENDLRMSAVGCQNYRRRLIAYTIASVLAGLAGALQAQCTDFVALNSLSFEASGGVLIMLILGGSGRLYGPMFGVPIYMIAQDYLSKIDPTNWYIWQGIILLVLVLFARGGVLTLAERCFHACFRKDAK
ncbi:MAG TPA: branched-chain amino acid ABC transporter permease [Rhodocyclaceae bacterium]|nr:branched-chain amino acid ABC transporter permease [Rhodocyclaceae bacterium]